MIGPARLELLDMLCEQLVAAARARGPTPEVHVATVQLVFARHYAQLEHVDRAKRLLADARALLPADPRGLLPLDPVHDLFLAIAAGAVPADLASRLEPLGRSERYVVHLFCERMRLLEGADAIDLFMLEDDRLERVTPADREGRTEQYSREMLAKIKADTGEVDSSIIDLVRNNRAMSAEGRRRFFEPTLDVIERVSPDLRSFAYAFAIETAVEVAPGRLEEIVERALPTLPGMSLEAVRLFAVPLLNVLVGALGRTHPHVLARLWRALPPASHCNPQYIAGLIRIGDPQAFERYHAFVAGAGPATGPLLRHAVLDHFLALPLAERFAEPWLVPLFARTADAVGTSWYFSASIAELVDTVVRSIVEAPDV